MCRRPVQIQAGNDLLSTLTLPCSAWPTVVSPERTKMFPMGMDTKGSVPPINHQHHHPATMLAAPIPVAPEPVVTIFCGNLIGRLHLHYFQCPGIHQPCIEFDGEMITPKEFCLRANKDKQKDWKGSIRAGKRSLRYMMGIKAIDFFNHREVCSGKCQSRNHLSRQSAEMKTVIKREVSVPMYQMRPIFNASGYVPYGLPPLQMPHAFTPLQNPMGGPMMIPNQAVNRPHEGEVSPTILASACVGKGYQTEAPPEMPIDGVMPTKQLLNYIDTDPLLFWSEVRRVELMPELLDMIATHVRNICTTAVDPTTNLGGCAPSLSRLTHALNLQQWIISRIQSYQGRYFAASKLHEPTAEKKAPVGIGEEAERVEAEQPVQQVMNDAEIFCDNVEPAQQPKETIVPIEPESPQSPRRPLKRHEPMGDEVPCKKMIVTLE